MLFYGFIIVVSMLVPGVSGSTMMIVLGIYDKTLTILSAWSKGKFIEKNFIFQLLLGGMAGLIIFPMVMKYFLEVHGYWMGFFFTGIIMAGLIFLFQEIEFKRLKWFDYLAFMVGIGLAFWMSLSPEFTLLHYGGAWYDKLLMVFLAGIVIAVALILPGISASYMLLLMGIYDRLLIALLYVQIQVLIPLALGIILGGLISVRTLTWVHKKHPNQLYLMISGFVLGSIPIIFPGFPSHDHVVFSMLWLLAGILVILILHRYSRNDML